MNFKFKGKMYRELTGPKRAIKIKDIVNKTTALELKRCCQYVKDHLGGLEDTFSVEEFLKSEYSDGSPFALPVDIGWLLRLNYIEEVKEKEFYEGSVFKYKGFYDAHYILVQTGSGIAQLICLNTGDRSSDTTYKRNPRTNKFPISEDFLQYHEYMGRFSESFSKSNNG